MLYKVNWKFEYRFIRYVGAKWYINLIQPILDTRIYYYQKTIFSQFRLYTIIYLKDWPIFSAKSQPYALGSTYSECEGLNKRPQRHYLCKVLFNCVHYCLICVLESKGIIWNWKLCYMGSSSGCSLIAPIFIPWRRIVKIMLFTKFGWINYSTSSGDMWFHLTECNATPIV